MIFRALGEVQLPHEACFRPGPRTFSKILRWKVSPSSFTRNLWKVALRIWKILPVVSFWMLEKSPTSFGLLAINAQWWESFKTKINPLLSDHNTIHFNDFGFKLIAEGIVLTTISHLDDIGIASKVRGARGQVMNVGRRKHCHRRNFTSCRFFSLLWQISHI